MLIHVVEQGQTVYGIAREYGVPAEKIIFDNQINFPDRLVPGQALLILEQAREQENQELVVNGYAYPYIRMDVLEEALLYLSGLLIFSYGFTAAGELVPTEDTLLLEAARRAGVEAWLVLTPFSDQGVFDNNLVTALTGNESVQEQLITELLRVVEEKGYVGVDVDFEYILPEDREGYVQFVARLRQVCNENGYLVSVALAPKTSSGQQGLLYEGMDYAGLGGAADHVFLMTYEWGYTYGPPMAVAPLNKVREVAQYALTQIPAEKIHLGMPNYGYDWPLPYERGRTRAQSIGNIQAVDIAVETNAVIQYDEIAQSPYFEYEQAGIAHVVWFEDVRSILAKLELVQELLLPGIGYWNLMRPFRPNWLLVQEKFRIAEEA